MDPDLVLVPVVVAPDQRGGTLARRGNRDGAVLAQGAPRKCWAHWVQDFRLEACNFVDQWAAYGNGVVLLSRRAVINQVVGAEIDPADKSQYTVDQNYFPVQASKQIGTHAQALDRKSTRLNSSH